MRLGQIRVSLPGRGGIRGFGPIRQLCSQAPGWRSALGQALWLGMPSPGVRGRVARLTQVSVETFVVDIRSPEGAYGLACRNACRMAGAPWLEQRVAEALCRNPNGGLLVKVRRLVPTLAQTIRPVRWVVGLSPPRPARLPYAPTAAYPASSLAPRPTDKSTSQPVARLLASRRSTAESSR